jgi:hypothetical protein
MKHARHVYLIASKNRLVIEKNQTPNPDYHFLFTSNADSEKIAIEQCNIFCSGVMFGNILGNYKLTNKRDEFNKV